jgi:uncharacterized 2Fe-2S/4Fe-4S cluster protein (DUF4445 family)
MEHFKITFKPDGSQILIHAGATILDAASQAGIILNTVCGGKGLCRKCLVNIEPAHQQVQACQYRIQTDLIVTVPPASRFFEQRILTCGIDAQPQIQPDIYRNYLQIAPDKTIFGLAVDIGTTTVVAKLIDMKSGDCLAVQADTNPQSRFGDDVISRIAYAGTDEGLAELQKLIVSCITDLLARCCEKAAVDADRIYEICIVGNTTMNHIFLGLPVEQLGRAPYSAFNLEAKDIPAGQTALGINPAGNIHTVENIAGFVGADTVAVALAAGIGSAEKMSLIIDIGTNGEVVLGTAGRLFAASCAAGPALEGARISCGSRASEGAIESVVVNEADIVLDVIGGGPARSLCGSGLIDAAAVLLDLGIIDPTGRFTEPQKLRRLLSAKIFSRIIEQNGQPAFILASSGQKVVLTQQDIRQMQLAKAAIRAGIRLLQKKIGIGDDDIEQLFLAGAFGNYIRAESALRVGLLPAVPPERIHFVGNAASSGAQLILVSSQMRKLAADLARRIEYVEIAHQPDFQSVFTDCMSF